MDRKREETTRTIVPLFRRSVAYLCKVALPSFLELGLCYGLDVHSECCVAGTLARVGTVEDEASRGVMTLSVVRTKPA